MDKNLKPLILKSLALAMGIASLVLSILGEADINTHISLLSLGLISLSLNEFENKQ